VRNMISEHDIHIMLSIDPLAIHRLSREAVNGENNVDGIVAIAGNASRFRDPKTPVLCDKSGRCTLHLVAQYSESLKLLEYVLQINHKMVKMAAKTEKATPLGSHCRRPHFSTFDKMFLFLIRADSTVKVISDGIIQRMRLCRKGLSDDISPGSSDERSLTLIRKL
jgi:hypothetical protein